MNRLTAIALAVPLACAGLAAAPALAADEVVVTPEMTFPADGTWHHYFDNNQGKRGKVNPGLGRAKAFLDTMKEAGVPADHVKTAVVIHGAAVMDVTRPERYARYYGEAENPNIKLIEELVAAGTEIWVCGVSAKAQGVGNADLLPGVKMAWSAMTANAELQRRGFTLNPY